MCHRTGRCYTRSVPTTRPRHLVTETDEVKGALDAAASRWPGLSRSQLLVRLALEGHRSNRSTMERENHRRLELVNRHAGALTGVYGPGAVDEMRADWPS